MADVNANIGISIDSSNALAQLKALQRQIALFHTSVARSSEAAALAQRSMQRNLVDSINSLGGFTAEMRTVRTTAESFTNSLEKNKFSMREYFRYAAASSRTFGRTFISEFDTVSKTAEDRVRRLQTQYIKMGRDASGAMKAIAVIPDALNMEDRNTQMQIAAQRQQIFNQLVRQGSTNLLNFGKNTQWAGRQLMVGFTLPLMTLGAVASKTFMDMEQAALKFRKVYGDLFTSKEETDAALESITQIAQAYTKYGISVAQTVALASDAAAAGFSGLDLQRQTEQATKLAVLGQIDQQQALETTISLQNAFKMSSDELAESIDFLNAVENQTVTGIEDLTIAIPKAAPVVRQLGGDVKDLAFFLTAMKEGGINASEGANALKSGLASIINPTGKAADMLAEMGINIDKIVESNRGDLRATVIEFAQALNQLDPLTRARAIEQLFGKFQFARISTLLQNVTQTGTQADRVLSLASASVQELADLSSKELGMTAASAMNKFKGAVEDLRFALVPVGEIFLNIVTPLIDILAKALDAFNGLEEGTKRAIATVTFVLAGIGPVALMTFGLLANGFANIIKSVQFLRNTFLRLTGQSQALGLSTEYLTIEQIDAAAAAASLNQAHASLTQQFTVEATAVNALRDAYLSAIAASNKFATANPGMMIPRRTPNLAQGGIIKGPGTGTSDSIVARVSNGEAIIPAKSVARFPDVVNGLISGNMPGFAKGFSTARSHVSMPFERGSTQWMAGVEMAGLQSLASQFPQYINIVSNLIAELPQKINIGLVKGLEQSVFSQAWQSRQGKMLGSAALGGLDIAVKENVDAVNFLEKEIHNAAIQMADSTADKKVNDEILSKATRSVIEANKNAQSAIGRAAAAFDRASRQIGQVRVQVPTADVRSGLASGQFTRGTSGKIMFGDIPVARESQSTPGKFRPASSYNPTKSYTRQILLSVENGVIDGINEAAQSASPSKRAKKSGKDIADGAILGLNSQIDDAQVAGERIASEIVNGATQSGRTRGGRRVSRAAGAPGTQPIVVTNIGRGNVVAGPIGEMPAEAQSGRQRGRYRPGVRTGVGPSGEMMKFFNLSPRAGMPIIPVTDVSRRQSNTVDELNNNLVETNSRMSKFTNNLTSVSFAASALSGVLMMATDNSNAALSDFMNKVFMASNALMAFSMINNLMPAGGIAGRFRGARQAAALASYGTAGGAGKVATRVATAGSGLPGVLSKVVPLFGRLAVGVSKFLGPWGLLIGGITVGVSLWKLYNKRQEEATQRIEGLGNAAKLSEDKLKSLGEFFGVTPLGGRFARARAGGGEEAVVAPEERSQLEQLKESEDFQKRFAQDIEALRGATNRQASIALRSIATQLISSGFSQAQVQTIVTAIQEEAAQTDVTIDFKTIDLGEKGGLKALQTSVNKMLKEFSAGYRKGGDELQRTTNLIVSSMTNTIEGISNQFETGMISAKRFNRAFNTLSQSIQNMPEPQAVMIMSTLMQNLPENLRAAAAGIQDVGAQMIFLQAQALGMSNQIISAAVATKAVLEDPAKMAREDGKSRKAMGDNWANFVSDVKNRAQTLQKALVEAGIITDPTETGTSGGTTGEKGLSALQKAVIKRYESELKALEKKRDALREVNDELKRQFEFEQRQNDIAQQMAEAKVSGNYIQVALLNQQRAFEASEFQRESQTLELEKRIGVIEDRIRQIEAGGRVSRAEAAVAGKVAARASRPSIAGNPRRPADIRQTPQPTTPQYQDRFNPSAGRIVTGGAENLGSGFIPLSQIPNFARNKSFTYRGIEFTIDPNNQSVWRDSVSRRQWSLRNMRDKGWGLKRFAQGGLIKGPGTETSDSIMAMVDSAKKFNAGGMIRVSNNEYIMRAKAVKDYGVGFMNSVNSGTYPANNTSTVYNSYKIDVSGVHDPEMAANLVMKKLQTISNKSASNSNTVSNTRKVWR